MGTTTLWRRHGRWACTAALALAAVGCRFGTSCTEVGCETGLTIQVSTDSWATGSYRIVISEAERSTTCSLTLAPGALGTGGEPQLGVTVAGTDASSVELSCKQSSGSEVAPWQLARVEFWGQLNIVVSGTPEAVGLSIDFAGTRLLDESITPSYHRFSPNGSECDPTCLEASAEFELNYPTSD